MIRIDLVTGFLGAGKTTFLLKYAEHLMSQGLRIGILEYDYGAVNVDMLLLNRLRGPKCELEMLAAACDADCLNRRFRTKLISMAMSGYDRVIIEPSGVFDMDLFFDSLREDPLERWYEAGNIIAVVGADLPEDMSPAEDYILASQAAPAGCVLLSRASSCTEEQIARTKAHVLRAEEAIRSSRLTDRFVLSDTCLMTPEMLSGVAECGHHAADYVKRAESGQEDFSSVCFLDFPGTLETVTKKIGQLFEEPSFGNVLRVKGFACTGGVRHEINATRNGILTAPTKSGQAVLIVIGTGLEEKKIRKLITENR